MSSSSPITSLSSQPKAKQDLSKTQHPSLVSSTNNNKTGVSQQQQQQQPNNPAVAVKLFQFNQGSRSVHVTRDVDHDNENSSPPRIYHPDNNNQNNTSISHNRLPSGARPSSAASLFSSSSSTKKKNKNNNTVLQQQQRPSSSASASSVVMISSDAKKKTMNNNNNRPNTAASMTSVNTTTTGTNKNIKNNNTTHNNNNSTNRATSASALYDRYDSKGHYGPECTQKNILHTRHKIQFQYGRIRRLQSSELGELIKVVKKGVKNAGKVLEKEDREKMGDDFVGQEGFGRSSFLKMNSMRRQGSSASMAQRADSRNSTQRENNNNADHNHDDDDDDRFGMMERKETAAFMGHRVESYDDKNNNNSNNKQNEDFIHNDDDGNGEEEEIKDDNEEDDDEIDAAFKSGQLAANKNNGRSNLRSAKPTSTTNRPMTAKVGGADAMTTVTTATRPLTSSVASRSQQQQQQPPPRAPSAGLSSHRQQQQQNDDVDVSPSMTAQQTAIIKRGGSPTLLALIKENTFRGQTVKLESKYLDNLQKFLSPPPPPVNNNRQQQEDENHQDIEQQQQQQQVGSGNTTRSNSPTGATRGNSPLQQNNNKTRPSSAISVSSSTNLGSRTRSPLTASILKGFSTPSASGRVGAGGDASSGRHGSSRSPGRTSQQQFLLEREKEREREFQKASRPASANHLLPGTRWHNAVDHGEVPPTTALDPAELPRDSRDVKIEGLPEELKFYAIKSNQRRPQSAASSMVATSRHNNNSKSTARSSNNHENESILQLSGQPPPSYFFEEPSLINVHDADAGFSPEAFSKSKNPIFSHLAAPSRFKNPKLVHLGCHPQHPNFNDENNNNDDSAETTPSKQQQQQQQQQHQKMMSMMSAPGTKEDNNGKSPTISPAQEKMLFAIQKERDMKDSLNSISTHSSGIIDYLHRRKQVCYCRYSSVIKRKMLELDHRKRQQKQQHHQNWSQEHFDDEQQQQ